MARVDLQKREREAKRQARIKLAWDYGTSLDQAPLGMFHDESLLPAPKIEIVRALLYMIANSKTKAEADLFTVALYTLSNYQEGVGASISSPLIKEGKMIHPTSAELGDILDAFPSHRVAQLSALMESDLRTMQTAIDAALSANLFLVPWYTKLKHYIFREGQYELWFSGRVDFMLDQ